MHDRILGLWRNPHAILGAESALRPLPRDPRSHQPTGAAETELELPEQSLTLAHTQLDFIGLIDPRRQRFATPKIDPHSCFAQLFPQHASDFFHLLFIESARPFRSLSLGQARHPLLIETDAPNIPPNAAHPPATARPLGIPCPARPIGRHAGGDLSAISQTAESPAANPTPKWHLLSQVVS
jgi:hypothetical protein